MSLNVKSDSTPVRGISEIAKEISNEWKNVHFSARPYLDAMYRLNTIDDVFYMDDAKTIILYFLGNAQSFRGPKAKELKAELKKIAGIK